MSLIEHHHEAGWYYLHLNGDLIFKRDLGDGPPEPGDFVRQVWPFIPNNRGQGYILLIEALALGANLDRVRELTVKWGFDSKDAQEFAKRANLALVAIDGPAGIRWRASFPDYISDESSQVGYGETCIEAFSVLASQGNIR